MSKAIIKPFCRSCRKDFSETHHRTTGGGILEGEAAFVCYNCEEMSIWPDPTCSASKDEKVSKDPSKMTNKELAGNLHDAVGLIGGGWVSRDQAVSIIVESGKRLNSLPDNRLIDEAGNKLFDGADLVELHKLGTISKDEIRALLGL